MALSDVLLVLLLTPAALTAVADAGMGRRRRAAAALAHATWWDRLGRVPYRRLAARAAEGFLRFPAVPLARRWPRLRFVIGGLATTGLVGAAFMGAGIALFASVPASAAGHALRYFLIPGLATATLSCFLGAALLARIARGSSLAAQLLYVVLLITQTVLLWLLLAYLGTWLEWQEKSTPTVFGSEWFLAEVYMEYVREPGGRLIALTTALVIGLPAALFITWIALAMGCKVLRPILAPALIRLVDNFATARPGAHALPALLLIVLAAAARAVSALP